MNMKITNIMILGANGFLGSSLVRYLSDVKNIHLTLFDSVPTKFDKYRVIVDNIENINQYEEILKEQDFIVNFIGKSGALSGFDVFEDFVQTNEIGMLRLLDSIKDYKDKPKIIFPSSRLVYSNDVVNPIVEDSEKMPLSIYGINKLSIEQYLNAYSNFYGVEFLVLRISIPFGYSENLHNEYGIINNMIASVRKGKEITIFGDGAQKRDLIYIRDLMEVIYLSIKNFKILKNEIYNAGGSFIYSINESANIIIKKIGKGKIIYKDWPKEYRKLETGDSFLNSTKLYDKINYKPKYSLEMGLDNISKLH